MQLVKGNKLIILAALTVLVLLLHSLGLIRYEENDDIVMLLFSSGAYTGSPEFRLVFINPLLGWLISSMYKLNTDIEVYTLILIALQTIAFTILFSSIQGHGLNKPYKYALYLLFFAFFVRFSLHLQFTKVAAITCLAGCCSLLDKNNKPWYALLFIILGSLIRFEAACLVLLIFMPAYFLLLKQQETIAYCLKTASLIALPVIGLWIVGEQINSSGEAWSQYHQFNKERTLINDHSKRSILWSSPPENYDAANLELFGEYAFMDPSFYNLEKLQNLSAIIKKQASTYKVSIVYHQFSALGIWISLGFALLIIRVYSFKKNSIISILPLLTAYVLFAYIASYATLKYRVFISGFTAALMAFSLFQLQERHRHIRIETLIVLLLSCGILYSNTNVIKQNLKHNKEAPALLSLLQSVKNLPGKTVIFEGGCHLEYLNPFSISKNFPCQKLFFNGWTAKIPYNYGHFESYQFLENRNYLWVDRERLSVAMELIPLAYNKTYEKKLRGKLLIENKENALLSFSLSTKPTDNQLLFNLH